MIKVKKKPFFLGLFFLLCCFIIFFISFFNLASSFFLKVFSKQIFGKSIKYQSLVVNKGQIELKGVEVANEYYEIKLDDAKISFQLSIKNFQVNTNLQLFHPSVYLKKISSDIGLIEKSNFKGSGFFKTKINIENGSLFLMDNFQYLFSLSQKDSDSPYYFKIKSHEGKKELLSTKVSFYQKKISASLDFNEIDCNKLFKILSFYKLGAIDIIEDVKGMASGRINCLLEKDRKNKFSSDFVFSNFFIKEKGNRTLQTDFFKIGVSSFEKEIKSDLIKKFASNLKMRLEMPNGEISFENSDISKISDISADLYFNPELGPKIIVDAIICKNRNEKDQIISQKLPVKLTSKGYFSSEFCNWMDLELSIFEGEEKASLCINLEETKDDNCKINFAAENFNHDFFDIIGFCDENNKLLKKIKFIDGKINSEIELDIKSGRKSLLNIRKFHGEKLQLSYDGKYNLSSQNILASFDLDLQKDLTQFFSLKIEMSDTDFYLKRENKDDLYFKDIKCFFLAKEGLVFPSSLSLDAMGLKTAIKLNGNISDLIATAEMKGSLKEILDHGFDDQLSAIFTFRRRNTGGYLSGIVQSTNVEVEKGQENLVFGITLKDVFNFDWKDTVTSMWLRGENIILDKYQKLLPKKSEKINGRANVIAFLQKDKLSFQMQAKDLKYENEYYSIFINKLGVFDDNFFEKKENLCLTYDCKNNSFDVEIPLVDGNFYLKKGDLSFDCRNSKIQVNDKMVEFILPEVMCNNINLGGEVFLDFDKPAHPKLDIVADKIKGQISDLSAMAGGFNLHMEPLSKIEGNFESIDSGFYFSKVLHNEKKEFSIGAKLLFNDVKYKFSDYFLLSDISFVFDWDGRDNNFSFEEFKGQMLFNNKPYFLQCPLFAKSGDQLAFDFRLGEMALDLIRLKGDVLISENQLKVLLDHDQSHLLGVNLDVTSLIFDSLYNIKSLDLNLNFNLFSIVPFIDFLPSKCRVWVNRSEGLFRTRFWLDEENIYRFDLKSNNFEYLNKKIENISFQGYKKENEYVIDRFLLDDIVFNGILENLDEKIKIKNIKAEVKESKVEAEGNFSFKDKKCDLIIKEILFEKDIMDPLFQLLDIDLKEISDVFLKGTGYFNLSFAKDLFYEADFDFNVAKAKFNSLIVENSSSLNLCFSNNDGLKISGLDLLFSADDLDLSLLKSNFKYIYYNLDEKCFSFEDGKMYIPKFLLAHTDRFFSENFKSFLNYTLALFKFDEDLDFPLSFKYDTLEKKCFFSSRDPVFHINGEKRILKNLSCELFKSSLFVEFDYLFLGDTHHVKNNLECASEIKGNLIIGDESDPLKISWKASERGVKVNRIKGSYLGLNADFSHFEQNEKPNSYFLKGVLDVDFSKILPSLFKDKLLSLSKMLGKGYRLVGEISLEKEMPNFIDFTGELSGKDFIVSNYAIKNLFSRVYISPKELKVKDFKISDFSGTVNIDSIEIEKKNDSIFFNMPLLEIKDCRPSLLKKLDGTSSEIKPLLIKNFKLEDFSGDLLNLSTIGGKGFFNFVNSFKRGHSIFEVPADVLGRILGLDLELLIPVIGDVFFEIKDQKVYFNKIKDVFSENKRSEFFLVDEPFMNFNGDLDINIKMKQYVLFKITDKFIISIRGNIQKPDFNLKKRKLFQSNS